MKKIAIALSVALLAATAYILVGGDDGLGEMTLKRLRGDVTVARAGEINELDDETGIEPGDRVTTGSQGRAELRLLGGRVVEMAPGTILTVVSSTSVDGLAGSLLVSSEGRDEVAVGFGGVAATTSEGVFRVDLGTGSSRVGVYDGTISVSSSGDSDVTIERFFEAAVAGNKRVLQPGPLQIDEGDAWDQIHLSDVLALDARITKLGNGLASQLGGSRPGVDYFSTLVNGPVGFVKPYLSDERVPDLLIGFTIARNSDSEIRSAFVRSFDLRGDDGRWGVIARIMSALERRLVAQLGRTIVGTGILTAEAAKETSFGPTSEAVGSPASDGGSTGGIPAGAPPPAPGGSGGGDGGGDGGGGAPPPGNGGDDPAGEPKPPPKEPGCPENPLACLEDPPIGDDGPLDEVPESPLDGAKSPLD